MKQRAETEEVVELTPEEEDALEESIAQIARGECVTAKESFDELRAMRERRGYEQKLRQNPRHF